MTKLATIERSPAIVAYEATMCRDMYQSELLPIIVDCYKLVCAYSGQKPITEPNALNLMAKLIENDLRQTHCTFEQFKIAVTEGMKSGEIFDASAPATYNKWVKRYLDSVRPEIMAYKPKESVSALSEDEKLDLIKKGVMLCYDNYKSTGYIQDAGDAVYLYLEGKGVIDIPVEVKKTLFEKEREAAIEKLKIKKYDLDIAKEPERYMAREIQRAIDSASRGEDVKEVVYEQRKICRTKILKDLFDEMTREEMENAI